MEYVHLFSNSGLLLMVYWEVPYLSKGHSLHFNNGLRGDSNSGPVLRRLFESELNNGPSLDHFNLVSDEVYICPGLLFMIFWWLPYLAKGLTPDFNNSPRKHLNSSRSLNPGVYSTLTPTMAHPKPSNAELLI